MPNDISPSLPEPLEITSFLAGRTLAWGIFEDRFGRVQRRFSVEMEGRWKGSEFHLEEAFLYDTGEREKKTWRITPLAAGRFAGTSDDCVGTALGRATDGSIVMTYRYRLRIEGREITVDFNDRIYRVAPDAAVNRAVMSKWGIVLGSTSIVFLKPGAAARPRLLQERVA